MNSYRLKKIQFLGNPVSVILQNENGPCPLLALSNILLLRKKISIHTDYASIDHEHLVDLIGSYIMEVNPPPKEDALKGNHAQHISDAIRLLPKLQVGLDVNVKFHGVREFEYTLDNVVFDMLDINLVHGWLVDEEDLLTKNVIDKFSYNQLVEKLINMETLRTQIDAAINKRQKEQELEEKLIKEIERNLKIQEQTVKTEIKDKVEEEFVLVDKNDAEIESKKEVKISPVAPVAVVPVAVDTNIESKEKVETAVNPNALTREQNKILEEGLIIRNFLDTSASQLTFHGLVMLHQQIKERELCVFFRNNHFSTLFKYNGELYLLVTDFGYLNEPEIVWEKLSQIDGDTVFITQDFRPYYPKAQNAKKDMPESIPDIEVSPEMLEEHKRAMQQLDQLKQQQQQQQQPIYNYNDNANDNGSRMNQQQQYYSPIEERTVDMINQLPPEFYQEQQLAMQQIEQQRLAQERQRYHQQQQQQQQQQQAYYEQPQQQRRAVNNSNDDCIIL